MHIDHVYTFDTQKKDLPKALESVLVQTICCWEHHCHQMYWWTEAYRGNLGTQDAQFMVQKFPPQSIHPTDTSQRLSQQLLIDMHKHLYIVANLGLVLQNYSLKFALKNNPSRGLICTLKWSISTRGK